MSYDTKQNLQELWKKEVAVRKEAQGWGTLADAGFIGLVATEIPEFFAKPKSEKSLLRVLSFAASSLSICVGVGMKWVRGNKAEALRESILMVEHGDALAPAAEGKNWGNTVAAEEKTSAGCCK